MLKFVVNIAVRSEPKGRYVIAVRSQTKRTGFASPMSDESRQLLWKKLSAWRQSQSAKADAEAEAKAEAASAGAIAGGQSDFFLEPHLFSATAGPASVVNEVNKYLPLLERPKKKPSTRTPKSNNNHVQLIPTAEAKKTSASTMNAIASSSVRPPSDHSTDNNSQ